MKTRFLIIISSILGIILLGSFSYVITDGLFFSKSNTIDRYPDCELAIFSGDDGVCLRPNQIGGLDWSSVETCEQTGKIIRCDPNVYPKIYTITPEKCAKLFDKIFDTWKVHVKENYGPGKAQLEPPSVSGLIADWEGGEEFRDSDCRYTVNNWAYLVEHQEQVWGHVDWPKLEPFEYIPAKYGDANTSLEIIFGEPYENELLPITIREATRKANNFEDITIWNFAFVKNTDNTQKFEYWDFIPKADRGSFDVVGGDFTSIINESKEYTTFVNAIAYVSEIDCGDLGIQEIETGSPYTIPIQKDNYHVFVDHKKFGIFPDEDGIYSFKMASFFDINNRSVDNMTMISEEYEHCDWIDNIHPHLDPEYPVEPTFVDWKFKLK